MNAMRRVGLRGTGEGTLRSRCLGLPNGETTTREGRKSRRRGGVAEAREALERTIPRRATSRNDGGSWRAQGGGGCGRRGSGPGLNQGAEMEGFLAPAVVDHVSAKRANPRSGGPPPSDCAEGRMTWRASSATSAHSR